MVKIGSVSMDTLLALEDSELTAEMFPGNPAYRNLRHTVLKTQLDHYSKELKRIGVNRTVLWE